MADINKILKDRKESKIAKVDIMFHKEFVNIAHQRVINGLDKRYNPILVQRKTLKHPLWGNIRKDLTFAEFLNDKKAQFSAFNLYTFIIVAFIAVILFAGLIYVMGLITGVMHQAGLSNEVNAGSPGYVNMTLAADQTFGAVNNSIQALRMVALVYVLGLAASMILTNFLIKIHPVFYFAYILLVILGVVLAAPVSNAYNDLLSQNLFAGTLVSMGTVNELMKHLPLTVLIVGILGGIFLFIQLLRAPGEGELR